MRLSDDQAYQPLDMVSTDFSGRVTHHLITGRYKVRNSQTGIVYEVQPPVPKSSEGNQTSRLDHGWFKRVGRIRIDQGKVELIEACALS